MKLLDPELFLITPRALGPVSETSLDQYLTYCYYFAFSTSSFPIAKLPDKFTTVE